MIRSLQLHILLKKSAGIPFCNGIYTQNVLFRGLREKTNRRNLLKEPGIRHRRELLQVNSDYPDEVIEEHELDDELNMMALDKFYDEDVRESKRFKEQIKLKITAKKFFSRRPQPPMLTYNERLCIKYLHKQDPVQWDVKTLSNSFPATPDTIKKIIKSVRKITPEMGQKIDVKVQENWELLAKGKLDADPDVLEHFKKFVNRREVLLTQLKNADFYLPEIKNEIVWNQGEMTSVISSYEKEIQKLAEENGPKAIADGESQDKEVKKSPLDLINKKIKNISKKLPENTSSFIFGMRTDRSGQGMTLEEVENEILNKAEKRKKLHVSEKAILDNTLGVRYESEKVMESSNLSVAQQEKTDWKEKKRTSGKYEDAFVDTARRSKKIHPKATLDKTLDVRYDNEKVMESSTPSVLEQEKMGDWKAEENRNNKYEDFIDTRRSKKVHLEEFVETLEYTQTHEKTQFGFETDIGDILYKLQRRPEEENIKLNSDSENEKVFNELQEKQEDMVDKVELSEKEKLKQENSFYDKEVLDIKNTAFWNNKRNSLQKVRAEYEKRDLDGPMEDDSFKKVPKVFVLSSEPYPERIKIPKNRRKSGLTFRVKDCYYDDDGWFLYRVPGMTK